MEQYMEELVPMGYLYVPLYVPAPIQFIHEATTAAFYGAIDILAILPYYIEIILQQDTVLLIIIPWACNTGFRTYSLAFSDHPFPLLDSAYVPVITCLPPVSQQQHYTTVRDGQSHTLWYNWNQNFRTIEVMYLSVRRSKHALLAIGFFALFVVILFSTLLSVVFFSHVSIPMSHFEWWCRYFAERGTWDSTLDIFINSDGDPTQFAVCQKCLF